MLLAINNLNLAFGPKTLFAEASFQIHPRERVGLVGPNGSGKTTLLRIINGLAECDSVDIEKPADATIGYLPQEGIVLSENSIFHEVEASASSIIELRKRLAEAEEALAAHPVDSQDYKDALERMGHYTHLLEEQESHKLSARIEKILFGLGFSQNDLEQSCESFSGGWQMRVALAKLLLAEPDVLMMDEPTNHLDLDSLRWLESFLAGYEGALLVISHDSAFLDSLCKRIISLERGEAISYTGNYTQFLDQREERQRQLEEAKKSQDRKIATTERFIERFRSKASKASQVQSRIKQLDKVERIELETADRQIQFRFPAARASGHTVAQLKHLCKAYGDKTVFKDFNLTIERGHRIGVVGVNGAGKSTLARILAGREAFQSGERIEGHNLELAYFAQDQTKELPLDSTVYEVASSFARSANETTVRNVLGAFLFNNADTAKQVKVLSGGEKNRLALARLLLRPANFIVLDEPTNHLDIASKAVLQNALDAFDGTLFIVSHDRDFLEPVVDRILEISTTQSRLFPGNLSDYLWKIDQERAIQPSSSTQTAKATLNSSSDNPKERRRRAAQLRSQTAPLRKEIQDAEKRIEKLESAISEREVKMADKAFFERGAASANELREYDSWKAELEKVLAAWEKNSAKLEEIEKSEDL